MASVNLKFTIKRAWWVMLFIHYHSLRYRLTGKPPDMDRFCRTLVRGWKLRVSP
jgi:hypothetical protein